MSDILDVEIALVQAVASAVYPKLSWDTPGVTWDSPQSWDAKAGPSISGTDIVVYPGWPNQDGLSADLAKGKTHITVFPKAEERNTTRYPEREHVVVRPVTTLTLAISAPSTGHKIFDTPGVTWDSGDYDAGIAHNILVTVGGTVSSPQNIALRINSKFYTYAVQPSDTLASIAASLGRLIGETIAGTSVSGPVITIGPTGRLQAARIGGFGTIAREVRRQERLMMITVWANAPGLRDQIAAAVDVALAQTQFLTMPDGFGARLIYKNSLVVDALQKANLYRRDLNYTVEYATTVAQQRAAVIAPSIEFQTDIAITA